ncbi:NBR1-Ig-like domain-containing protein [Amycolatopsis anabasis]|uniref:NBR1-Ig-like domain-containing protein n=1 Tax=Amycolatopsis anabasis TaxID=1840409 RepID=UPI001FE79CB6|nr:NBR1-Ig-like domain-containing protein [Amycolatopsis anabasis]
MSDEVVPGAGRTRQAEIAQFAAELRRLRAAAGDPSFRKMAEVSGYVSRTTLHEAAQGVRMPSWDTTREFVRACGGDEAEWKARWQRLQDGPEDLPAPREEQPSPEPGRTARRGWSTRGVALLTSGVAVVCSIVTAAVVAAVRPAETPPAAPRTTPTDQEPLVPGDLSRFVVDVTYPDGATVRTGQTFTKVWEIENAGTAVWHDRYLQRRELPIEPGDCVTPERTPIGDVLPNERVKVMVQVTAPATPTQCTVSFKMVDRSGRSFFPASRPVYFSVNVTGS